MASFKHCFLLSVIVALSSINISLAARYLLDTPAAAPLPAIPLPTSPLPPLPKPTLPPLPSLPTVPTATLPPLPSTPLPTLPTPQPTLPKATLPPLPSTPLPTLPAQSTLPKATLPTTSLNSIANTSSSINSTKAHNATFAKHPNPISAKSNPYFRSHSSKGGIASIAFNPTPHNSFTSYHSNNNPNYPLSLPTSLQLSLQSRPPIRL